MFRSVVWLALAVLFCVAVGAGAQSDYLAAELEWVQQLPINEGVVVGSAFDLEVPGYSANPEVPRLDFSEYDADPAYCWGGSFTTGVGNSSLFTFEDSAEDQACGGIAWTVAVPEDARTLRAEFHAKRNILQDASSARRVLQRIDVRDALGERLETRDVYAPDAPSRDSFQEGDGRPLSIEIWSGAGVDQLQVMWWFQDGAVGQGAPGASGQLAQAAVATLENPHVIYSAGAADATATRRGGATFQGERRSTIDIEVRVEPTRIDGFSPQIQFDLAPGYFAHAVQGPGGEVYAVNLVTSDRREADGSPFERHTLGFEFFQEHGYGTYVVSFSRLDVGAVEPYLIPVAAAGIVLPGVLAGRSWWAYRSVRGQLERGHGQSLYAAQWLVTGVYLLALVFILVTGGLRAMTFWPTVAEAGLYYGVLILTAFLFTILSFTWRGQRLNRLLASQVDELTDIRNQLARSNQDLEMLATAASHDLREPLRSLVEDTDELATAQGLTTAERDRLDLARSRAHRLDAMVAGLLDYARLGSSERPLEKANLADIAIDVLQDLEVPIRDAGANVKLGHLPEVVGDAQQLRRLVQNLVQNALRHAGNAPTIHLHGSEGEESWHMFVDDDGPGVAPEQREKVFRPFRGSGAGAVGLGLTMCRRIAERHGGALLLEDAPEGGARFHLHLPKAGASTAVVPDVASSDWTHAAVDVLVVDDSPVHRANVGNLMRGAGHEVRFAEDGAEALRQVELRKPDLVVMDIEMPVMDGLAATRTLRKKYADLLILGATGHRADEMRAKGRRAGMDELVEKPLSADVLSAWLARAAESRGLDPATLHDMGRLLGAEGRNEILEAFAVEGEKLAKILQGRDKQEIQRALHTLKSSCAAVGAKEAARLSRECEAALRGGTMSRAQLYEAREAVLLALDQARQARRAA